ncbi:MAG: YceI family protein [Gallionella sp.]
MSHLMPTGNRTCRMTGLLLCALITSAPSAPLHAQEGPADFPEAYYRQAVVQGGKVLRVNSAQSLVVIEVHRAGVLARLGHNHVVASHHVSGYASIAEGLADLYIPLEKLVVDEPGLRTEAGFNSQPSQEDIEATRQNMLNKTLNFKHFPYALIHIIRADTSHQTLNVSITLHGMTRAYEVPVQIEALSNGIAIDGKMSFNQTDFDITPLSVFGGAIKVQNKLDLRFHIIAQND